MELPSLFISLAKQFKDNGFKLYLIGGASRDYLLGKEIHDYDFATDARPDEMKIFLKNADFTFSKYGHVGLTYLNKHLDITTLRKEDEYLDSRHPSKIIFTKKIEEDFVRRDFTINAIYIDADNKIYDFTNGVSDLKNKIIRFIGDPTKRVKEDPLRILRAIRFSENLGFVIEENSLKAINDNYVLIKKLNPSKVEEEINKKNNYHVI